MECRTEQAAQVHSKYMAKRSQDGRIVVSNFVPTTAVPGPDYKNSLSDSELLSKMFAAKNGAAIRALWNGDISTYGNDDSRADSALCAHLAYWTNSDPTRIDRLFRSSSLYREKWDRDDYRERTISGAIETSRSQAVTRIFHCEQTDQFINPLENPTRYTLDDIGAARHFADNYRSIVMYLPEYKDYWAYSAGVWEQDKGSVIVRGLAKQLADYMRVIIPSPNPTEKVDPYEAERKQYAKYRFMNYRKTQLQDAQDELSGRAVQFDHDPYLFNVKNGTYNLKTGILQPHNSADKISKMANVIYDHAAKCERFEQFIYEISEGKSDRINMLQKALGYCLKGEANEECYFTAIGHKTRNGKGTLFDTMLNIFGSYGAQMDFNTIARGGARDGSRATPDLARLRGVRFVEANEPEKGVCINEALVKQLTGNDDIAARPLYGDVVQFKPVFRLFVLANSKPAVSDDSLFASGRIKLLPFDRFFDENERDTGLKAQFRTEEAKSGIFNWLLAGFAKYQAEGLRDTAEMKALTAAYRHENDYIAQFIDERFDFTAIGSTSLTQFRREYAQWCEDVGTKPLGRKLLKEELEKRGIEIKTIHNNQAGISGKLRSYEL